MRHRSIWLTTAILVVAASGLAWYVVHQPAKSAPGQTPSAVVPAVPVTAGLAETKNIPVYLTGLGTVQAFNTVVVKVRVDGQLDKVAFTEGQDVKAGDLLAQIDPRPFQAALDQAKAVKTKDEAQLENAKRDLQRFINLHDFATKQSVDTQNALVRQLEATIQGDQAAIESAQTQLAYSTITAPLSGRTGVRLIDQGNIVHASDASGLVMITQLQPISVMFSLSDRQLTNISREMANGPLKVIAEGRTDHQPLGEGTLTLVDNQIDQGTGTIRLKATFPNEDHALWPGQFINIRLLLRTLQQVVTVPSTAIQRGPNGMYVYVIKPDSTVAMQPVSVGQMNDGTSVVESGLHPGDKIVVRGQYRLQPGTRVQAGATIVSVLGGM
ncbi:membrane fusion protein, multidrug efflux system [Bradyrhizobium erythrophlei]|nr:membrane fusion protein, multidrug efflux system [Bradyrhizobium erythrophlei]